MKKVKILRSAFNAWLATNGRVDNARSMAAYSLSLSLEDDEEVELVEILDTPTAAPITAAPITGLAADFAAGLFAQGGRHESLLSKQTALLFGIMENSNSRNDFEGLRKLFSLLEGKEITCTVMKASRLSIKDIPNLTKPQKEAIKQKAKETGKTLYGIGYTLSCSVDVDVEKTVVFPLAFTKLVKEFEEHVFDKCSFSIGGTCNANVEEYEIGENYVLGLIPA